MFMFWISEGREQREAFIARSKVEVPPPGYAGSLAGTGWDPDVMLDEYSQAAGSPTVGTMPDQK